MARFKRVEINGILAGYAQQNSPDSVSTYPIDHPVIWAWLAEGNTADPADEPVVLPDKNQILLELLDSVTPGDDEFQTVLWLVTRETLS